MSAVKRPDTAAKETIIEGPDLAAMSVEEAVRYYVETYDTDEHDARELVLAAKGLLTRASYRIDE
ncbi:MAG: hypothetical protein ACYDAR_16760 [Thermomicrobiales bacterium]